MMRADFFRCEYLLQGGGEGMGRLPAAGGGKSEQWFTGKSFLMTPPAICRLHLYCVNSSWDRWLVSVELQ